MYTHQHDALLGQHQHDAQSTGSVRYGLRQNRSVRATHTSEQDYQCVPSPPNICGILEPSTDSSTDYRT